MTTPAQGPDTPTPPQRADAVRDMLQQMGYSQREAATATAAIRAAAGLGTAADNVVRYSKVTADWVVQRAGDVRDATVATVNAGIAAGQWTGRQAAAGYNATVNAGQQAGQWTGRQAAAGVNATVNAGQQAGQWTGRQAAAGYNATVNTGVAAGNWVRDQAVSAYNATRQGAEKAMTAVSRWWSENRGKSTLRAAAIADVFQGDRFEPGTRRMIHDSGTSKQDLLQMRSDLVNAVYSADPREAQWHLQNLQNTINEVRDRAGLQPDNSPWVQREDGSVVARDQAPPELQGANQGSINVAWVTGPQPAAQGAVSSAPASGSGAANNPHGQATSNRDTTRGPAGRGG